MGGEPCSQEAGSGPSVTTPAPPAILSGLEGVMRVGAPCVTRQWDVGTSQLCRCLGSITSYQWVPQTAVCIGLTVGTWIKGGLQAILVGGRVWESTLFFIFFPRCNSASSSFRRWPYMNIFTGKKNQFQHSVTESMLWMHGVSFGADEQRVRDAGAGTEDGTLT